jgi:DNA-binding transcriptional regulator YiaG
MLELFSLEFDGKKLTELKSDSLKENLFSKKKKTDDLEERVSQDSASSFFLENNECFRVGNRIKEFRISRGMSRDLFAKQLDPCLSKKEVKTWEMGNKLPSMYYFYRMANVYGLSVNYLLAYEH